jgi:hypothetical protein
MSAVSDTLQRLKIIVDETGCEYPQAIACLEKLEALQPAAEGSPAGQPQRRAAPPDNRPTVVAPPAEYKDLRSQWYAQDVEVDFLSDGTAAVRGQVVQLEDLKKRVAALITRDEAVKNGAA